MKLTNKQLKQIIKEELDNVLKEVMIDPDDIVQQALKDPKVDNKIKNLLGMKDPELVKQGLEFLSILYPEKYEGAKDVDPLNTTPEYQKKFDTTMQMHKDGSTIEGIYDILENHPEVTEQIIEEFGSVVLRSYNKEALESAMADFEKEFPDGEFDIFYSNEGESNIGTYRAGYTGTVKYQAQFQITKKSVDQYGRPQTRPFKDGRKMKKMVQQRRFGDDAYKHP